MPQTKAKEDLLLVEELQVDTLKIDDVELTATATELNILDGALLDVDELNKLNGATVTTQEINLNDKEAQTLTDNRGVGLKLST